MRSRSAFFSPPAVAGLALLAVVLGAAIGLRSGFSPTEPDTTAVAGNVIERSEPAETEPADTADDDPIVIPLPPPDRDEPVAADDSDDDVAAQAPAPAPAPAQEPVVGIIRDTPPPVIPADNTNDRDNDSAGDDSDGDADETPSRPRRDRPRPAPEPTPDETKSPAPSSPSPEPEDVALRTGEGHSRDTAIADNGEWLFREVSGHGSQGPDDSREAQARVVVAFNDEAKQSTEVVRSFQCQAWVTAGEGRLTTDTDHVFEVALLALDDNGAVTDTVTSVIERHAYDLSAGQTTQNAPMTTSPVELSAEDGISYTCGVRYRDR